MGMAFLRTTRALNADRGTGGTFAIVAALLLLIIWSGWFVFGRITVYQASRAAYVEVSSSSRQIATLNGGRLVASGLFIGRKVRAGEILAELDSEQEILRLAQAEARLSGYPSRIAALHQELASSQIARTGTQRAKNSELATAAARTREAQASADFNRSFAGKQQADSAAGASAPVEAERAEAEALRAAAARDAAHLDEARIADAASVQGADRDSNSANIAASVAVAQNDEAAARLLVAQLRLDLEARKIRAPADGVIGEVTAVRVGEVLAAGARLATIVPDGDLHIVAAFDPATGLGRLTAGQQGRLRLNGFSWAQYGDFSARVERVAAEASNNVLRVDLSLPRSQTGQLALRHGMTGQVEVAIEQVSPAVLLLRAIGEVMA
jgi:multidrug resistance efflux pump